MADVAAGSSANLDEFSSNGEVEITSEEPTSMLQKLRAKKRKIQCNSLEDYLEGFYHAAI